MADDLTLAPDRDEYEECFGCGQTHPYGLRMRFAVTGEHTVESRITAHDTHAGAPGVVHGGLQATMLDEVAGYACHTLDAEGEQGDYVTAGLELRFRRPVPTGVELRCISRVVEVDGPNVHTESVIVLPDDTEATRATSRWKRLD